MKKYIFTLLTIVAVNTAFSQDKADITLCRNTDNVVKFEKWNKKTIDKASLLKCSELYSTDANFKVKSFKVGITTMENDYVVLTIEGNSLNEKAKALINKHNPKAVYIEQVNLIDQKGNASLGKPLTILLKQ